MPTNLATAAILDAVVAQIRAKWGNPPNLGSGPATVHQTGALRTFAAPADLGALLPAIIVYPQAANTVAPADLGHSEFRFDFRARVLYAREFVPGGDVERTFYTEVDKLAQTFLDDVSLGEPVISDGQVLWAITEVVEPWAAEAEALVGEERGDILVGAVTVLVSYDTRR